MTTMKAEPIAGAEAWLGADMARSTDWIRPVPASAVTELEAALDGPDPGPLLALEGALERAAALPHRPLRRGDPPVRAQGAGGRLEPDRECGERGQRDPRAAPRSPRPALAGLLAEPPGRGGGRRV